MGTSLLDDFREDPKDDVNGGRETVLETKASGKVSGDSRKSRTGTDT